MKVLVDEKIVLMFKNTEKNVNYMLDYLLSSIDSHNCKDYFKIIEDIKLDNKKLEVEINDTNIKYIESLFEKCDDKLIECLLWVSVLFQEV